MEDISSYLLSIKTELGGAISSTYGITAKNWIHTGNPSLDFQFSNGKGIATGRIYLLWGGENSGKTTTLLTLASAICSNNGHLFMIDQERRLEDKSPIRFGLKEDQVSPYCCENLDTAVKLIFTILNKVKEIRKRNPEFKAVIGIDSITALISENRIGATVTEDGSKATPASEAVIWSNSWPSIVSLCSLTETTIIMTSQKRSKIGVMYGSPDKHSGGNSAGHYASNRYRFNKMAMADTKYDGDTPISTNIKITCDKNTFTPTGKESVLTIGEGGFCYFSSLVAELISNKVIETKGGSDKKVKNLIVSNEELIKSLDLTEVKEYKSDTFLKKELVKNKQFRDKCLELLYKNLEVDLKHIQEYADNAYILGKKRQLVEEHKVEQFEDKEKKKRKKAKAEDQVNDEK